MPGPGGRIAAALLLTACASAPGAGPAREEEALARQVEIRRTTYGVPQIRATNLRAAAFALAYVQLEDHGAGVIRGMQAARGRLAEVEGEASVDADARARQRHERAVATFDMLRADTRAVYAGFAAGMNHFIRTNPARVPDWARPDFTAVDVLARDITWPTDGAMAEFRTRIATLPAGAALLIEGAAGRWERAPAGAGGDVRILLHERVPDDDVGSNAWALAPSRTTSGRAILLRNPHLAWTAGYYEAHVRVPGALDFYGDFRIGGPFTVIGGFNADLGFATTNNASRSHEFYALRVDPARPDHVLLDGRSLPLRRDIITVDYRADTGAERTAQREFWRTDIGPVVHRDDAYVYVLRAGASGDYRAGEQWLAMMKARSFEEWKDAMRIGARTTSNFTYADRAGNIFYVWVAAAPALPHPAGGDTLAILAERSAHVWSSVVPFDSLPHVLNPPGGYVHNENDSPHFTNLHAPLADSFYYWVEPPSLRLRSQHALEILHNDRRFSLEDVVAAKHSMRMLLADRVKPDLIAAVRAAAPDGQITAALALLERWDNSAAAESRGGVLFDVWWSRYRTLTRGQEPHAEAWSAADPVRTPRGLAEPQRAAEAFAWAVTETARRYGMFDVAWGDVHRVRRGDVDVAVGGCSGALGCFRVLTFAEQDGRRVVNGGDGWIIAVEFGDVPRAYSVLAYGQSPDPASPWHANQAAMFAENRMKPVHWTEADIAAHTVRRYRPGLRP